MKRYFMATMIAVFLIMTASTSPAMAKTPNPPAATGEVTGKIINQNKGTVVTESLEVMLHIWDEKYTELNMLHGTSQTDGTFRFTEVELKPEQIYGVMAIYKDVVYISETVPAVSGSDKLELTVPVYETTTDLSAVQVDQMHVLWNFASDGLETTEVYVLSNTGERTVKDAFTLEDGKLATLRFPLPSDADFIFFEPAQENRFIKFSGGFADTNALMLGEGSGQITVKYLTPYQENRVYTYTAPVDIHAINFLLPENSGVTIHGEGLSDPQPRNLNNGEAFLVYSLSDIKAGQTVEVAFSGTPNLEGKTSAQKTTLPIVLGGILLGLAMIGSGVWWWRRPEANDNGTDEAGTEVTDERAFDDVITEIAQLDETFERGDVDEEEYHQERKLLRQEAKNKLDQQD